MNIEKVIEERRKIKKAHRLKLKKQVTKLIEPYEKIYKNNEGFFIQIINKTVYEIIKSKQISSEEINKILKETMIESLFKSNTELRKRMKLLNKKQKSKRNENK